MAAFGVTGILGITSVRDAHDGSELLMQYPETIRDQGCVGRLRNQIKNRFTALAAANNSMAIR